VDLRNRHPSMLLDPIPYVRHGIGSRFYLGIGSIAGVSSGLVESYVWRSQFYFDTLISGVCQFL